MTNHEAQLLYHQIFLEEEYLQQGTTIKDGDVIFDVGANIGMFSLFCTRHAKNLQIHAFEPIPPTFDRLQRNIAMHMMKDSKVQAYPIGLFSKEDQATFGYDPYVSFSAGMFRAEMQANAKRDAGLLRWIRATSADLTVYAPSPLRSLVNSWMQLPLLVSWPTYLLYICYGILVTIRSILCVKHVKVPLRTVSSVMREAGVKKIDLLKVDVEGAELEVLKGVDDADWPKIKQCVVEVQDVKGRCDEMVALLRKQGFHVVVEDPKQEFVQLLNEKTVYAQRK